MYIHSKRSDYVFAMEVSWPSSVGITWTVVVRTGPVDIEADKIIVAARRGVGRHVTIVGSVDGTLPCADLPVRIPEVPNQHYLAHI